MQAVSVVIIAKNEAENIGDAIISAKQIADDIVVADSGSTDDTEKICTSLGARIVQLEWTGFGAARNAAAEHATNEWVFALDADERISAELARAIKDLNANKKFVYGCKRLNFLYGKPVHFGEWGNDVQYRLYNQNSFQFTNVPVHETLDAAISAKKKIAGTLSHLTMKDEDEYERKTIRYAKLMAEKNYAAGTKAASVKRMLSPAFSFIQNYILRLGFLDGKQGLAIARMSSKYRFLKYKFLQELQQQHKN